MGRLYKLGKPPGMTFHSRLYKLAFTSFTGVYYIDDLHQRCTRWSEYYLKLPYLQHSLLVRRVFFMSSIHASAAPDCTTASAALGSSSLVFVLPASTLLPVLQASTLLHVLQAPTLLPVLQASSLLQVFKCSHSFQVFKCLHSFQVFKCHHCFRCTVLAIDWHFHWIYTSSEVFHRLTS